MACHCGGNSTSALLKLHQLDLSCVIRNTHKQTPPEQCPRLTLKFYVQKIYIRKYVQKNLCPGYKSEFFSHEMRPDTKPEAKFPGEHVHTRNVRETMSTNYVKKLCQKNLCPGKCPTNLCPGNKSEFFFP